MRIWRNSITVLWAIIYPITNDQAGQMVNEKEAVVCLSRRCRKPPRDFYSTCLCVMRSVLWWRNQESVITFKFDSLRKRLEFIYWICSNWEPIRSGFMARLELFRSSTKTVAHLQTVKSHAMFACGGEDIQALLLGDIRKHLCFYVLRRLNLLSRDPV